MSICTTYDSYLQDQDTTVWIAELSDGTMVYGDDHRYGENDRAWSRLREYLDTINYWWQKDSESHFLKIEKLFIKFRSHTELVAERTENTVGWYFGRAASAWVGCPTVDYFVVGTVKTLEDSGIALAYTTKWRVPEIIEDEKDTRNPEDYKENIIYDTNSSIESSLL